MPVLLRLGEFRHPCRAHVFRTDFWILKSTTFVLTILNFINLIMHVQGPRFLTTHGWKIGLDSRPAVTLDGYISCFKLIGGKIENKKIFPLLLVCNVGPYFFPKDEEKENAVTFWIWFSVGFIANMRALSKLPKTTFLFPILYIPPGFRLASISMMKE